MAKTWGVVLSYADDTFNAIETPDLFVTFWALRDVLGATFLAIFGGHFRAGFNR